MCVCNTNDNPISWDCSIGKGSDESKLISAVIPPPGVPVRAQAWRSRTESTATLPSWLASQSSQMSCLLNLWLSSSIWAPMDPFLWDCLPIVRQETSLELFVPNYRRKKQTNYSIRQIQWHKDIWKRPYMPALHHKRTNTCEFSLLSNSLILKK